MTFGDHDEDLSDDRQFCKHGRFIGSWWGPDYMCGLCEDGVTDEEYAEICAREEQQALAAAALDHFIRVDFDGIAHSLPLHAGTSKQFAAWVVLTLDEIKATPADDLKAYLS